MRLVIIEDEIRTLEGIRRLIHKVKPDYEIVATAPNGCEGLEVIRQQQPDFIITDIRMPEMDGLEMLTQLHETGTPVKAIVLSAYSEFQYARKAIQLGVTEYILKPVAVGDLTQALKRVEVQVEEQKKQSGQPEALQSLEYIYQGILIKNIEINEEVIRFIKQVHGVEAGAESILVSIYLGEQYEAKKSRMKKQIRSLLERDHWSDFQIISMTQERSIVIVLRQYEDRSGTERYIRQVLMGELERESERAIGVGMTACASLDQMEEVFYRLQEYMDWSLVLGRQVVIVWPKILQVQTKPLSYPIEAERQMKAALCGGGADRCREEMERFQVYFRDGNIYRPKEVKESYIRFLWSMINVSKELGNEQTGQIQQQELLDQIMSAITYEELTRAADQVLALLLCREEKESDNYLIRRTKSLIHEYYQEGITLDEIAGRLQITPEYLGTLFHRSTGQNFTAYIKEYRITEAKKLLLGSGLKQYEIAEKVGYMDPKYFSRVFREVTGELPAEYRKRHK